MTCYSIISFKHSINPFLNHLPHLRVFRIIIKVCITLSCSMLLFKSYFYPIFISLLILLLSLFCPAFIKHFQSYFILPFSYLHINLIPYHYHLNLCGNKRPKAYKKLSCFPSSYLIIHSLINLNSSHKNRAEGFTLSSIFCCISNSTPYGVAVRLWWKSAGFSRNHQGLVGGYIVVLMSFITSLCYA